MNFFCYIELVGTSFCWYLFKITLLFIELVPGSYKPIHNWKTTCPVSVGITLKVRGWFFCDRLGSTTMAAPNWDGLKEKQNHSTCGRLWPPVDLRFWLLPIFVMDFDLDFDLDILMVIDISIFVRTIDHRKILIYWWSCIWCISWIYRFIGRKRTFQRTWHDNVIVDKPCSSKNIVVLNWNDNHELLTSLTILMGNLKSNVSSSFAYRMVPTSDKLAYNTL